MAIALVFLLRKLYEEYKNLFSKSSEELLALMFDLGVSICFETKEIIFLLPPSNNENFKAAMICLAILEARKNGRRLLCKTKRRFLVGQVGSDGKTITRKRRN